MDFANDPFITWSPPSFYSDDILQGISTTYHVCVKSENGSIIADDNTTDIFYQLPSNITVCDIYTASVTGLLNNTVHLLQLLLNNILEVRSYQLSI